MYEKLDYLSQLTEVVVSPQMELLASLPDRIEIDAELLASMQGDRGIYGFEMIPSITLRSVNLYAPWEQLTEIAKKFEFEYSDDFAWDPQISKMYGTCALVKKSNAFEERDILAKAASNAGYVLSNYSWPPKGLKEKVATVLDLFEPGSGLKWRQEVTGRIGWAAQQALRTAITEVITENKWRIRDAALIERVGYWINDYLADGMEQSKGLINLLKLKLMLDKGDPVYSVDEVR